MFEDWGACACVCVSDLICVFLFLLYDVVSLQVPLI